MATTDFAPKHAGDDSIPGRSRVIWLATVLSIVALLLVCVALVLVAARQG